MAAFRSLQGVYQPPAAHWVGDGFEVQQYLPGSHRLVQEVSPFLMMDYHAPAYYAPTTSQRGVGSHPHRGFETVTLVYAGRLAHHDSAGNSGVIGPGDVQWMTAASGILHAEYHERNWARQGGLLHSVQLWVNLPARYKMADPRYQSLLDAQMGRVALDDQGSELRVIAGTYQGVKGPALTWTPVTLLDAQLQPQAQIVLDLPAEHSLSVLVMAGQVRVNGERSVGQQELVVFAHDAERVELVAESESQLLILGGEPIREPVVSYGPFVMNTKAQLLQAMTDFESGKFGQLRLEAPSR
ncbi:MAG: pirin family protein [Candidatus Sericytochromatia bacterium]